MNNLDNSCEKIAEIEDEKILIFGGSGSLGKSVIRRWIKVNKIVNVSRDEEKQWELRNYVFNDKNLNQYIGDISIEKDVENIILSEQPSIICIFACLKHIDLCEKFPNKSILINSNGIMNVYNTLNKFKTNVHSVLFVSTDKACLPITTYGYCKAISESFLQNIKFKGIKWVAVRYGNVLNSSGSIIPCLKDNNKEYYTLTHPEMTRFIMTLDQSINLIEYALIKGKHNEIIIPNIQSMRIKDLFEIFEEKYNKKSVITGLRCKEKIHEDLLSDLEAKMTYKVNGYYHITMKYQNTDIKNFDSSMHLIDKETLKSYLITKNLL